MKKGPYGPYRRAYPPAGAKPIIRCPGCGRFLEQHPQQSRARCIARECARFDQWIIHPEWVTGSIRAP